MKALYCFIDGLIISATACLFIVVKIYPALWFMVPVFLLLFLLINVMPSPDNFKYKSFRLRVCAEGADLLCAFLVATVITVVIYICLAFYIFSENKLSYIISSIAAVIVLSIVFWNGIIRVYLTSVQLGLKYRVIGLLLGWIPIANVIALIKIISICYTEVDFEYNKERLNESRKDDMVCKTKYPLLFVHGVFFRDSGLVNYWGRIPNELIKNGAIVYYGNHQSALSVADSGAELAERVKQIVEETGCEKVNVIAHSKGGLDCRYAIAVCGSDQYIASLTTINTPHRGCFFADYLLNKVPEGTKNTIARAYNATLKRLGDSNPDFLSAVYDLTNEKCELLNETIADSPYVYYQSVGSRLSRASGGKFPLNFTYHLAKYFDGPNDGLVSEASFEWGDSYTFLTTNGERGISHGDMIDLNRENIKDFDVREFYVRLISGLKEKGF